MRACLLVALCAALLAGCGVGAQTAAEPSAAPTVEPSVAPTVEPSVAPTVAPTVAPSAAPTVDADQAAPAGVVPIAELATLRFGLEPVAEGFDQPTHMTTAGDGSGRLFVTEQAGMIWVVREGQRLPEPFLDLTSVVGLNGNEQGLLSVAFHPRFAENGILFVNYTDDNGDTVVARYSVSADNPDRADAASATTLLTIDQPAPNHNGGLMKFGPDGMLYIGTGDGGGGGDPLGNGQSLDTLLGKLLRVDVDGGEPYAVPADNPFVGQEGARPEIWAYGLRNPWRFSFDRATGDLFIADVGQNAQEEVHFQAASSSGGENYGWNIMEGDSCFRASTCDQAELELPIATYAHNGPEGGCSITGGYVYRGKQFPELTGAYLFADYCTGNLWALRSEGAAWQQAIVGKLEIRVSSFGEDDAGELYLTDRGGGLYRLIVEE